jgi:hypothetical protein
VAAKLKLVNKNDIPTMPPRPIRGKQLVVSPLPDGSSALLLLSEEGIVYILGTEGWMSYNMMEAGHG